MGERGVDQPVVVLGVCGGIAAYKAVEVLRLLTEAGCAVSPILTEAATEFIGPLTFSALAAEPAEVSLYGGAHPSPHTRLGQKADLVLVCPATARLIGSYAAGISDHLSGLIHGLEFVGDHQAGAFAGEEQGTGPANA